MPVADGREVVDAITQSRWGVQEKAHLDDRRESETDLRRAPLNIVKIIARASTHARRWRWPSRL